MDNQSIKWEKDCKKVVQYAFNEARSENARCLTSARLARVMINFYKAHELIGVRKYALLNSIVENERDQVASGETLCDFDMELDNVFVLAMTETGDGCVYMCNKVLFDVLASIPTLKPLMTTKKNK